jgi:hypothetical protein
MLLITSLLVVLGTLAVLVLNLETDTAELRFGYEQMIHARIPWLIFGALGAGCALGLVSIARRRAWYKYPVVGAELLLSGLVVWYVLGLSFVPAHELRVGPGDPFPAYSLPDQDGRLHSVEVSVPRPPALYVFYRGDW